MRALLFLALALRCLWLHKMPYRKMARMQRKRKSEKSLLHYLPVIDNDYFMDTVAMRRNYPEIANSPI